MNYKKIGMLICAVLIAALLSIGDVEGVEQTFERLSLSVPNFQMGKNERIMGFKIIVLNGSVYSIPRIPSGWDMDINVDPLWKTIVTAHIVVGAAALTSEDIKFFNDFLYVVNEGNKETPLSIEVEIIKSKDLVQETHLVFKMKDLKLKELKE
jgi:hypothetical protein